MKNFMNAVSGFTNDLIALLKNRLFWLLICLNIFVIASVFEVGAKHGRRSMAMELENSRSEECSDTPSRTGWLAIREGEFRCFLEHKQFPHRAKGGFIVSDTFYERVASWSTY